MRELLQTKIFSKEYSKYVSNLWYNLVFIPVWLSSESQFKIRKQNFKN